jgi:hypothetical protein
VKINLEQNQPFPLSGGENHPLFKTFLLWRFSNMNQVGGHTEMNPFCPAIQQFLTPD